MPSQALQAFENALDEVAALGSASHPSLSRKHPGSLRIARAVGRGQIVLLSSHFERYFYAVNEEIVYYINTKAVSCEKLEMIFRLQHAVDPVEQMSETGWDRRTAHIADFVRTDGWLWSPGMTGAIAHERLLVWMKAPNPRSLVRYFKLWGIDDIFEAVTRNKKSKGNLWLNVQGLVDLRNNIAHGDYEAKTTPSDVRRYSKIMLDFCNRVDRKISENVHRKLSIPRPW